MQTNKREPDLGRLHGELEAFLATEISAGTFPGASYAIGTAREVVLRGAAGAKSVVPLRSDATTDTIYDTASLTKPLVTATLALIAAQEGRLGLHDRASEHLRELDGVADKRAITIVDLLSHRAGFQAWYPLYAAGTSREAYLAGILNRPLRCSPGTGAIYSDLGYILLGILLERAFDRSFGELAAAKIIRPLGLDAAFVNPDSSLRARIAPTEMGNEHERDMVAGRGLAFDSFRTGLIHGEVNDGNAWHIGGCAGNAGLFATADAIVRLAQAHMMGGSLLTGESIRLATRNHTLGFAENRGLGWQLQSARADYPSAPFGSRCFGHTGFTGTSVWVDPQRDLVVALMTNRIHPVVRETGIQSARRRFHEIVVREWDGA